MYQQTALTCCHILLIDIFHNLTYFWPFKIGKYYMVIYVILNLKIELILRKNSNPSQLKFQITQDMYQNKEMIKASIRQ